MAIRMSGLASGMDTEAIVSELVKAQSTKKTKLQASKTKEEWKQDIWKDLNKEIYSFYTDQVMKLRLKGGYSSRKVTSSDESKATATASADAPNGTQTIKVKSSASAQKWTSAKLDSSITKDSTLQELGMELGAQIQIQAGTGVNAGYRSLTINEDTTVNDFITACKNAGINANFDSANHRIFMSSKNSGVDNAFSISVLESNSGEAQASASIRAGVDYDSLTTTEQRKIDSCINTLAVIDKDDLDQKLAEGTITSDEYDVKNAQYEEAFGYISERAVASYDSSVLLSDISALVMGRKEGINSGLAELGFAGADAKLVDATNAEVEYNGATLTSNSNKIEVNGITFALKNVKEGDEISVSVESDTESTYDKVKEFVSAYNTLLEKLNDLFNAKSAKGYEPLTAEEKEAMTDEEVKLWEDKIKASLLRRDETLGGLKDAMRSALASSVKVDGKSYSLASFGIETSADYTEYGKLHIRGDQDDSKYAEKSDKLKKGLAENPDLVADVLSGVMTNLYKTLNDKMKSSNLSSALTFYNDKKMKKSIEQYEKDITKQEDKLAELEERYYKQFTVMEKTLSLMNQKSSYLSGFFG